MPRRCNTGTPIPECLDVGAPQHGETRPVLGRVRSWSDPLPRDLVCFSHLRWDFVYQRPNHLMARAARDRRVYFVEEPRLEAATTPRLETVGRGGVTVTTPILPDGLGQTAADSALSALMASLFRTERIVRPTLWYYTPMALPWTRRLVAGAAIYDSMDYLAGFRGAPPGLLTLEAELLERVGAVFCGGASLHERMRLRHRASHCFPSSVDVDHFSAARRRQPDPSDQAAIARPRVGYAGVIDERIDLDLIEGLAARRPGWQIVLLGPIVKIDPEDVPAHHNVHRLGMKPYAELPSYLAGWDIGWMPFARNDATRYISPTKTPEYLAASLPVVSTSITDVVEPYGRDGLVSIADDVEGTIKAVQSALDGAGFDRRRVDSFLSARSWDRTWEAMAAIIEGLETNTSTSQRSTRPKLPTWSGDAVPATAELGVG
jgi:UDP-galactopyranose mutase